MQEEMDVENLGLNSFNFPCLIAISVLSVVSASVEPIVSRNRTQ